MHFVCKRLQDMVAKAYSLFPPKYIAFWLKPYFPPIQAWHNLKLAPFSSPYRTWLLKLFFPAHIGCGF